MSASARQTAQRAGRSGAHQQPAACGRGGAHRSAAIGTGTAQLTRTRGAPTPWLRSINPCLREPKPRLARLPGRRSRCGAVAAAPAPAAWQCSSPPPQRIEGVAGAAAQPDPQRRRVAGRRIRRTQPQVPSGLAPQLYVCVRRLLRAMTAVTVCHPLSLPPPYSVCAQLQRCDISQRCTYHTRRRCLPPRASLSLAICIQLTHARSRERPELTRHLQPSGVLQPIEGQPAELCTTGEAITHLIVQGLQHGADRAASG